MEEEVGKIWKDFGEGKECDQMLYEKRVLVIHKLKQCEKMETFGLQKSEKRSRVLEFRDIIRANTKYNTES